MTPGDPQPCSRNPQTHGTPPAPHPAGCGDAWWCQGRHNHWDTCWWPLGQEPAAGHSTKWPLSHPCDQQLIPDHATSWDTPWHPLAPPQRWLCHSCSWPRAVTVTRESLPDMCSTLCPNPALVQPGPGSSHHQHLAVPSSHPFPGGTRPPRPRHRTPGAATACTVSSQVLLCALPGMSLVGSCPCLTPVWNGGAWGAGCPHQGGWPKAPVALEGHS